MTGNGTPDGRSDDARQAQADDQPYEPPPPVPHWLQPPDTADPGDMSPADQGLLPEPLGFAAPLPQATDSGWPPSPPTQFGRPDSVDQPAPATSSAVADQGEARPPSPEAVANDEPTPASQHTAPPAEEISWSAPPPVDTAWGTAPPPAWLPAAELPARPPAEPPELIEPVPWGGPALPARQHSEPTPAIPPPPEAASGSARSTADGSSPSVPAASPAPAAPFEPWRTGERRPRGRLQRRTLIVSAAAVVAVGVVAAGVTALLTGGDSSSSDADARDATSIFAAEPAARTDGLDQELNAVASMGDTTVAAGGVADHTGYRAAFLVSTDGARSFRLGSVLRPNGEAPSLGEVPRQIAGRQGAWVALGSRPGGTALWTSGDGRSWIRQPDAASTAFGPRDRVVQLVGDPSGFVAVGGTSAKGDFTDVAPVYWHSKDGRTWQRIAGDQLGMDPQGGTIELVNAAVNGPTILAQGVRTKKRSRPLNAVWKSGNGGRSWSEVDVPAPAGTIGLTIAAGGRGFVAAREIAHGGNAKATVFTSPDGNRWTKTGDITAPGYQRLWRLWPSSQGLSAAVNADGVVRLLRSGDATTWQPTGEVPVSAERIVAGSADSGGSSVIVGRDLGDDVNPVLAVRDAQGQDVQARIPSLQADHVVQTVAAGRDRLVAAGSTNGDAAVWTSGDGNDWSRADVKALARPGRQRLLNVTSGSAGWLAVGVDATAPWRPLVAASTDGSAWQALDGGKAFEPQSRTPLVTYAAASSPSGYVIVGEDGFAPAAWFSSDLRSWTRAAGVTKDDLAGTQEANRWMRGVAGGSFGYVAVGGLRDPSVKNAQAVRPCVWTSADGQKWAAHQLPVPTETSEGWLRSVAVKGNVLVAVGTANIPTGARHFAFVSSDGGRNWQETDLPNAGNAVPDSSMKVTATPKGFVAVGTTGYQANADVVMWTSTDGRNWKRSADPPEGLGGQGDQELTGLAASGSRLLGVGASADAEGRRPLLWRTPVP